jgi:hypothetical protein
MKRWDRHRQQETMGMPKNLTSKCRQMIQSWSNEDEQENSATDLLTPHQWKGIEQTSQEGPSKQAAAPTLGMPIASTAATSPVPQPSEGG